MSTAPPAGTSTGGGPQMPPPGPPYVPQVAQVGGLPTPSIDTPVSAVFLLLFLLSAAFNMAVFQINLRRSHKFIMSLLLFAFSMARALALVMRIVWASRPTNVGIAIAANVLTAAGIVILFIVNLIFAQRLLRAYHPRFGWHAAPSWFFTFLYFCVVAMLVMVVTVSVQSFYTLDANTRRIDRDVQLFAGTFLAVLAFLPVPIVLGAMFWPRGPSHRVEKFGRGRLRTKVRLLLFTATLLTIGAGFRIGTSFAPRPIDQPAWYHHRAAYYCFNFVIEIIVVYTYALSRFDRRFHVPDGASGPGHYAAGAEGLQRKSSRLSDRINTEAEAFGPDDTRPPTATEQAAMRRDWEAGVEKELQKEASGEAV